MKSAKELKADRQKLFNALVYVHRKIALIENEEFHEERSQRIGTLRVALDRVYANRRNLT